VQGHRLLEEREAYGRTRRVHRSNETKVPVQIIVAAAVPTGGCNRVSQPEQNLKFDQESLKTLKQADHSIEFVQRGACGEVATLSIGFFQQQPSDLSRRRTLDARHARTYGVV